MVIGRSFAKLNSKMAANTGLCFDYDIIRKLINNKHDWIWTQNVHEMHMVIWCFLTNFLNRIGNPRWSPLQYLVFSIVLYGKTNKCNEVHLYILMIIWWAIQALWASKFVKHNHEPSSQYFIVAIRGFCEMFSPM